MAYDEGLAERIRGVLDEREGVVEKKMFGGIAFMLRGNLCVGVHKQDLIVRVGAAASDAMLKEKHTRPFDITGKPMKGWVLIEPEGVEDDEQSKEWIERATKFVKSLPAK